MSEMDCPNCDGTGYTQDAAGEDILCPMCDGTGILFDDEDNPDDGEGRCADLRRQRSLLFVLEQTA